MSEAPEKFTAYWKTEPSREQLKAAAKKATALLSQATEPRPQRPELQQLAERMGTERQALCERLRALREEFSRRVRSSS